MNRRQLLAASSATLLSLSGCVGRNDPLVTASSFQIRLGNETENTVEMEVTATIDGEEIVVTKKLSPESDAQFRKELPKEFPWSEPDVRVTAKAVVGDDTVRDAREWTVEGSCDAGTFVAVGMAGEPVLRVSPRCIR